MLLVVFDANVWVSAFALRRGIPMQLVSLARGRSVRCLTSDPLIDQVIGALQRINTPSGTVRAAEINMRQISRVIRPTRHLTIVEGKESDNRVLECAVSGGADYIVSGDKRHLLPLKSVQEISIVSPREFLSIIVQENR